MELVSLPQEMGEMDTGKEMKLTNYWWWRDCRWKESGTGYFLFPQKHPKAPQTTQTRSKMSNPLPPARYLYRLGEQPHKSQGDRLSACLVTMRWQGQKVTHICLLSLWAPKTPEWLLKGEESRRILQKAALSRLQESPAGSGPMHSLYYLAVLLNTYLSLATFWGELGGLWRLSPFLRVWIDTNQSTEMLVTKTFTLNLSCQRWNSHPCQLFGGTHIQS